MALAALNVAAEDNYTILSPDKGIEVRLGISDTDHILRYEVFYNGESIIKPSALGLQLNTVTMNTFDGSVSTSCEVNETFTMPHGKVKEHHNHYNELAVTGAATIKQRNLTVRFRVYDDAVAFRYEISNRQGSFVTDDLSEFNFACVNTVRAQTFRKDYSWYYTPRSYAETVDAGDLCVPVLVQCEGDVYALLTEAASSSAMAACRLSATGNNGFDYKPDSQSTINSSNYESPWRAVIIGNLNDIVKSTRICDLNPAPDADIDWSWVKPGRVSWNWGAEDGDSNPTIEQALRYIDMATALGWEYFLLDDGWEDRLDLATIADYAASKNVGLIVWSHQNRFDNNYENILNRLSAWSNIGVKGVKIDFFEDDSQSMMQKYQNLLKAAAECHIMVDFHGCTRPSGLERTWPHLMTNEAVLGGEFYMFNSTMTPGSHTVNLALTRNVLGSMDYTPVKFGNKAGRVITDTSWAYQLALATAFESAWQVICDTPENIIGSIAEPLLRLLPVTWDEIRCLEATPDSNVSLARRSGDDWWIATLTAEARTAEIKLDMLTPGTDYYAHIYTEGGHRSDIAYECRSVTSADVISLTLGDNSGATVVVTTDANMLRPQSIKMEAEKYNRYCDRVADANCSGGAYLTGIGGTRKKILLTDITVPADGTYYLTLFYKQSEALDAYISVNDGEKTYYRFGNGKNQWSFVSIPVDLAKGSNTIAIGNETSDAPSFDRAVVTWYQRGESGDAGVEMPEAALQPGIKVIGGTQIQVEVASKATLTLFNTMGVAVGCYALVPGSNQVASPISGVVIANVTTTTMSKSMKLLIK